MAVAPDSSLAKRLRVFMDSSFVDPHVAV